MMSIQTKNTSEYIETYKISLLQNRKNSDVCLHICSHSSDTIENEFFFKFASQKF